METVSSKLEAAINKVFMPFTSPKPKRFSRKRLGTNTAGLTADNVNLSNEHKQYNLLCDTVIYTKMYNISMNILNILYIL